MINDGVDLTDDYSEDKTKQIYSDQGINGDNSHGPYGRSTTSAGQIESAYKIDPSTNVQPENAPRPSSTENTASNPYTLGN